MTMMHRPETDDPRSLTARAQDEAHRWDRRVDRLLAAFDGSDDVPGQLTSKMEALRHKRDSLVTKAHALSRSPEGGRSLVLDEYRNARRELRETWRSIIKTLDRESALL